MGHNGDTQYCMFQAEKKPVTVVTVLIFLSHRQIL